MRCETQNLIVRRFQLSDKDDLCEYMSQRTAAKFEGYPWFNVNRAQDVIKKRVNDEAFLAIELREAHKVIGNVYLSKKEFNTYELGYVLNENYQRHGYGYEACRAAMDFLFSNGVHRIYAETAPENTASVMLMEKLGMRREAFFKKNVSFHVDENGNPIYWDTYVYAVLEEEWKTQKR